MEKQILKFLNEYYNGVFEITKQVESDYSDHKGFSKLQREKVLNECLANLDKNKKYKIPDFKIEGCNVTVYYSNGSTMKLFANEHTCFIPNQLNLSILPEDALKGILSEQDARKKSSLEAKRKRHKEIDRLNACGYKVTPKKYDLKIFEGKTTNEIRFEGIYKCYRFFDFEGKTYFFDFDINIIEGFSGKVKFLDVFMGKIAAELDDVCMYYNAEDELWSENYYINS